uniref:Uncharacterized protein n=1 Tax=Solanum lycopersicum TaxID=4081 RepID=A0A3Q7EGE9_SOLLC
MRRIKVQLMMSKSYSTTLSVVRPRNGSRRIYNMCTQKPPHDYSQQLYDKYREAFEEYIITTVRVAAVFIHISL